MAQVALTTPSVALWDEDWAGDINTKQWQYYSKNNIDDSADATVNPDEAWRRYSAARAPLEMAACRDAARAAKRAAKRAGANATGGQSGRSGGEQRLNPGTKLVADESEDEDGDDEDDYDSEHCECYIAPSHLRSMVADAVSSFPGLTEQGRGLLGRSMYVTNCGAEYCERDEVDNFEARARVFGIDSPNVVDVFHRFHSRSSTRGFVYAERRRFALRASSVQKIRSALFSTPASAGLSSRLSDYHLMRWLLAGVGYDPEQSKKLPHGIVIRHTCDGYEFVNLRRVCRAPLRSDAHWAEHDFNASIRQKQQDERDEDELARERAYFQRMRSADEERFFDWKEEGEPDEYELARERAYAADVERFGNWGTQDAHGMGGGGGGGVNTSRELSEDSNGDPWRRDTREGGSRRGGSGVSSTYGWVLHRGSLLVWRVEDDLQATVRRLQLPQAPTGRVFVAVVPHAGSSSLTVALCTAAGLLCVWLDANFFAPPYTQQLFVGAGADDGDATPGVVAAMAAAAADAAGAPGFLAVISTADGALHLYHGSQKGIFPRQFHRPSAAGGGDGSTGGGSGTGGAGAGGASALLGSIGGVVKALYSEAFDPLYRVQRPSASRLPARQLLLLRAGAGGGGAAWRLLALSAEALDCWALGAANAASAADERLVWSFNLRGASLDASRHALSVFDLRPETIPHLESTSTAEGAAASALPRAPAAGGAGAAGWRLLAHPRAGAALARAPNGAVVEWVPGEDGAVTQVLASGSDNIDAACGADNGLWQVLNAKYGVLLMSAAGDPHTAPAAGPAGGLSEQAVLDLLESTVGLMVREYGAGCPYAELAEGLGARLERLGLFGGGAAAAGLVVAYSSSVVDQMPKEGVSGAGGVAALQDLLSKKALRHDMLLTALEAGGALARLPGAVGAALFSHAQQLAAAAAALELLPELGAAAQDGIAGAGEAQAAAVGALEAAGALAAEGAPEPVLVERAPWEPFFARPTAGAPALFTAAAAAAGQLRSDLSEHAAVTDADAGSSGRGGSVVGAEAASARLQGLGLLLSRAALGADRKRGQLAGAFRDADVRQRGAVAAAGGGWLCSADARAAWDQIAQACLILKPRLPSLQARLLLDESAHLPATAALLGATREALRALAPRRGGAATGGGGAEGAAAALEAAYAAARDQNAGSLLADAGEELEELRAAGVVPPSDEDSAAAASGALIWRVESLALEHACHPQLYDALQLLLSAGLDDASRMLGHMRRELATAAAAADPHATFTRHAMDRLRSEGRVRELLQLGRKGFAPQLLSYLAAHPHLLWLAQAGAGRWGDAAGALLAAAQSVQVLRGAGSGPPDQEAGRVIAALQALAAAPDELRERHRSLWEAGWQRLLDLTDTQRLIELRNAQLQGGGRGGGGDGGTDEGEGEGAEGVRGEDEGFAAALDASPLCEGLVACAAALLACTPLEATPRPAEVLDGIGGWLRGRAAGDRTRAEVLEGAIEAAARRCAPLLMASADA
ncbi:hypothetical protein MNEG_1855 [Monoraphidium neglectum]|uniref:Uncharacterized protein n=1 Tax=Monoraphidium neglectum TaxID=145388 RepID=A0A0D2MU85_9CHLO|nr:hypothetical protein MNEG_1855 [Monoraphidium neglectum]KIZ06100.1 hypothetical protein MNEG_1855 [Monoraphidium neglectum]|eukprot:XP_013905119.1 hypothetical protein MNEG_1855 [Monoraphidium neglectum]